MDDSRDGLDSVFLGATAVGIVLVGESGRVVLANEDAEKLFGGGRRGLVGHLLEELLPGSAPEPGTGSGAVPGSAPIAELTGSRRVLLGRRLDGSHLAVEAEFRTVVRDSRRLIIATVQRARALEERERIAAVLTDTVAKRLLALSLSLTAGTTCGDRDTMTARVHASVDEVDRILALIRDAVFPRSPTEGGRAAAGYRQDLASATLPRARVRAVSDRAEDGLSRALTSGDGQAAAGRGSVGSGDRVSRIDRSVGSAGLHDEPTMPGRALGRDWTADSPLSDRPGPEPTLWVLSSTSDTASTGKPRSRGEHGAASYVMGPHRRGLRAQWRSRRTESRIPLDLDAVCSSCGYSAASLTPDDMITAVVAVPDRYRDALARFGTLEEIDAALRWRCLSTGWSALERIAHVADSLHASAKCMVSLLEGDRSCVAPVHIDAPRAGSQAAPSRVVLASLTASVTDLSRVATRAHGQASLRLVQANTHDVTARDLLDDALHEAQHHLVDVEHLLASALSDLGEERAEDLRALATTHTPQ